MAAEVDAAGLVRLLESKSVSSPEALQQVATALSSLAEQDHHGQRAMDVLEVGEKLAQLLVEPRGWDGPEAPAVATLAGLAAASLSTIAAGNLAKAPEHASATLAQLLNKKAALMDRKRYGEMSAAAGTAPQGGAAQGGGASTPDDPMAAYREADRAWRTNLSFGSWVDCRRFNAQTGQQVWTKGQVMMEDGTRLCVVFEELQQESWFDRSSQDICEDHTKIPDRPAAPASAGTAGQTWPEGWQASLAVGDNVDLKLSTSERSRTGIAKPKDRWLQGTVTGLRGHEVEVGVFVHTRGGLGVVDPMSRRPRLGIEAASGNTMRLNMTVQQHREQLRPLGTYAVGNQLALRQVVDDSADEAAGSPPPLDTPSSDQVVDRFVEGTTSATVSAALGSPAFLDATRTAVVAGLLPSALALLGDPDLQGCDPNALSGKATFCLLAVLAEVSPLLHTSTSRAFSPRLLRTFERLVGNISGSNLAKLADKASVPEALRDVWCPAPAKPAFLEEQKDSLALATAKHDGNADAAIADLKRIPMGSRVCLMFTEVAPGLHATMAALCAAVERETAWFYTANRLYKAVAERSLAAFQDGQARFNDRLGGFTVLMWLCRCVFPFPVDGLITPVRLAVATRADQAREPTTAELRRPGAQIWLRREVIIDWLLPAGLLDQVFVGANAEARVTARPFVERAWPLLRLACREGRFSGDVQDSVLASITQGQPDAAITTLVEMLNRRVVEYLKEDQLKEIWRRLDSMPKANLRLPVVDLVRHMARKGTGKDHMAAEYLASRHLMDLCWECSLSEAGVPPDVANAFADTLVGLMELPQLRVYTKLFFNKGSRSVLTDHGTVFSGLGVAERVLRMLSPTIQHGHRASPRWSALQTAQRIAGGQSKPLSQLSIEDLEFFRAKAEEELAAVPPPQRAETLMAPHQQHTFLAHLRRRLHFLALIMTDGPFVMSRSVLVAIWDRHVKQALCEAEQRETLLWLTRHVRAERSGDQAFEQDALNSLFTSRVLDGQGRSLSWVYRGGVAPAAAAAAAAAAGGGAGSAGGAMAASPVEVSPVVLNFVAEMFLAVNSASDTPPLVAKEGGGRFSLPFDGLLSVRMRCDDSNFLAGLPALVEIAMRAADANVGARALSLLVAVYAGLRGPGAAATQQKLVEQLMQATQAAAAAAAAQPANEVLKRHARAVGCRALHGLHSLLSRVQGTASNSELVALQRCRPQAQWAPLATVEVDLECKLPTVDPTSHRVLPQRLRLRVPASHSLFDIRAIAARRFCAAPSVMDIKVGSLPSGIADFVAGLRVAGSNQVAVAGDGMDGGPMRSIDLEEGSLTPIACSLLGGPARAGDVLPPSFLSYSLHDLEWDKGAGLKLVLEPNQQQARLRVGTSPLLDTAGHMVPRLGDIVRGWFKAYSQEGGGQCVTRGDLSRFLVACTGNSAHGPDSTVVKRILRDYAKGGEGASLTHDEFYGLLEATCVKQHDATMRGYIGAHGFDHSFTHANELAEQARSTEMANVPVASSLMAWVSQSAEVQAMLATCMAMRDSPAPSLAWSLQARLPPLHTALHAVLSDPAAAGPAALDPATTPLVTAATRLQLMLGLLLPVQADQGVPRRAAFVQPAPAGLALASLAGAGVQEWRARFLQGGGMAAVVKLISETPAGALFTPGDLPVDLQAEVRAECEALLHRLVAVVASVCARVAATANAATDQALLAVLEDRSDQDAAEASSGSALGAIGYESLDTLALMRLLGGEDAAGVPSKTPPPGPAAPAGATPAAAAAASGGAEVKAPPEAADGAVEAAAELRALAASLQPLVNALAKVLNAPELAKNTLEVAGTMVTAQQATECAARAAAVMAGTWCALQACDSAAVAASFGADNADGLKFLSALLFTGGAGGRAVRRSWAWSALRAGRSDPVVARRILEHLLQLDMASEERQAGCEQFYWLLGELVRTCAQQGNVDGLTGVCRSYLELLRRHEVSEVAVAAETDPAVVAVRRQLAERPGPAAPAEEVARWQEQWQDASALPACDSDDEQLIGVLHVLREFARSAPDSFREALAAETASAAGGAAAAGGGGAGATDNGALRLTKALWSLCLFPSEEQQSAALRRQQQHGSSARDAILPPLCKRPRSRRAAFGFLTALVDLDAAVADGMLASAELLVRRVERFQDWSYKPGCSARAECGLLGLKNLQNICYLNSTMQQIFMIPKARQAVLRANCSVAAGQPSVLRSVQSLFGFLTASDRQFAVPLELTRTYMDFGQRGLDVSVQQDAQQFLLGVVDQMAAEMDPDHRERLMSTMQLELRTDGVVEGHPEFHSVSEGDKQLTLGVTIDHRKDLQAALTAGLEPDVVSGYRSQEIGDGEYDLKRYTTVKHLPEFVVCHLNRFRLNYETGNAEKLNGSFEFPTSINLEEFTTEGQAWRIRKRAAEAAAGGETPGEGAAAAGADGSPAAGSAEPAADASAAAAAGGGGEGAAEDGAEEAAAPAATGASGPVELPPGPAKSFPDITGPYQLHDKRYYQFRLVGAVIHRGHANAGHYYSFARDPEGADEQAWLRMDDSVVSPIRMSRALMQAECFGGTTTVTQFDEQDNPIAIEEENNTNAYMLVYRRATKEEFAQSEEAEAAAAAAAIERQASGELAAESKEEGGQDCGGSATGADEDAGSAAGLGSPPALRHLRSNSRMEGLQELPPDIAAAVVRDNSQFVMDRLVYSSSSMLFLADLSEQVGRRAVAAAGEDGGALACRIVAWGARAACNVAARSAVAAGMGRLVGSIETTLAALPAAVAARAAARALRDVAVTAHPGQESPPLLESLLLNENNASRKHSASLLQALLAATLPKDPEELVKATGTSAVNAIAARDRAAGAQSDQPAVVGATALRVWADHWPLALDKWFKMEPYTQVAAGLAVTHASVRQWLTSDLPADPSDASHAPRPAWLITLLDAALQASSPIPTAPSGNGSGVRPKIGNMALRPPVGGILKCAAMIAGRAHLPSAAPPFDFSPQALELEGASPEKRVLEQLVSKDAPAPAPAPAPVRTFLGTVRATPPPAAAGPAILPFPTVGSGPPLADQTPGPAMPPDLLACLTCRRFFELCLLDRHAEAQGLALANRFAAGDRDTSAMLCSLAAALVVAPDYDRRWVGWQLCDSLIGVEDELAQWRIRRLLFGGSADQQGAGAAAGSGSGSQRDGLFGALLAKRFPRSSADSACLEGCVALLSLALARPTLLEELSRAGPASPTEVPNDTKTTQWMHRFSLRLRRRVRSKRALCKAEDIAALHSALRQFEVAAYGAAEPLLEGEEKVTLLRNMPTDNYDLTFEISMVDDVADDRSPRRIQWRVFNRHPSHVFSMGLVWTSTPRAQARCNYEFPLEPVTVTVPPSTERGQVIFSAPLLNPTRRPSTDGTEWEYQWQRL